MTQPNPSAEEVQKGIQQQAGKLFSQVTGYIGVRNMDMRIRFGLLEEISKHPQGITAETLAANTGMDPFLHRGVVPIRLRLGITGARR
jgi:hypothetical protein